MSQTDQNPFHAGELQAHARAGVGDVAKWAAGFIRDYLPEQHRDFYTELPFFVVAGGDADGQTWVTLIEGPEGFVTSPDPRRILLDTEVDETDPLAAAFQRGTDIGILGIELSNRRRNRFSGHVRTTPEGYAIDVRQSFGNCPQYIHERAWTRVARSAPPVARRAAALSDTQMGWIAAADTLFIGSGHQGAAEAASSGYDASHRGGAPGFVNVVDATHLQIPDYAGNNFFNTIGNLMADPRVGLVFVDFETGGLLHVTGRATVDWSPRGAHDPDAWRMINIEIDAVLERPAAVSLRWHKQDHLSRRLKLVRREAESADITSFYFKAADGRALAPFEAGQHLPIEVQIPGQAGTSKRSYSLSGDPADRSLYRLSIKREAQGLVSRFLHDELREGSLIEARNPAGEFVVPCDQCPLVLVSAGVGLTPMLSALYAAADQTSRPVWYVHGARSGRDHALRNEVARLVAGNENLRQRIFYSRPEADDVEGRDYDMRGRVSAAELLALGAGPEARYMLCGPAPFLADIRNGLEAAGVPANQIHFETFGPAG